jgi:hypothetical protein
MFLSRSRIVEASPAAGEAELIFARGEKNELALLAYVANGGRETRIFEMVHGPGRHQIDVARALAENEQSDVTVLIVASR